MVQKGRLQFNWRSFPLSKYIHLKLKDYHKNLHRGHCSWSLCMVRYQYCRRNAILIVLLIFFKQVNIFYSEMTVVQNENVVEYFQFLIAVKISLEKPVWQFATKGETFSTKHSILSSTCIVRSRS